MERIRVLFFLFLFFFYGGAADLMAQNTDTPNAVRNVIDEVELGVQVNGGVQLRRRTLQPLQERTLNYLKKPVSGALSHSVPYYGVGVAL